MARTQVAGRGRDPPGRGRCSELVSLHREPRQQGRRDVDGSRRTEISAIHYPQKGKLLKGIVRSDSIPEEERKIASLGL